MKEKENIRLAKNILVGLVVLQVIILGMTMFKVKGGGGGSASSSSLLPIWIAIMIPIIVSRNKKPVKGERAKWLLWMLVGLALLVLIGMVLFLINN